MSAPSSSDALPPPPLPPAPLPAADRVRVRDAAAEASLTTLWDAFSAAAEADATLHPLPPPPAWARPATLALGGAGAALLLVLTPFLLVPALPRRLFGALPWLATSRARVGRALDALSPAAAPKGAVFVDLGSGDGGCILEAAARGLRARGVELNPTLALAANARGARTHLGDLFRHSVADADLVWLYGVGPLMPRLAAKLAAEGKPSLVVLSHRFKLPGEPGGWRLHGTVDSVHVHSRADASPLR